MKLCECGCGEPVSKPRNRYVRGHQCRSPQYNAEIRRKLPLCECGCGEPTRWRDGKYSRFIAGHQGRGVKKAAEHRRKMSERMKGNRLALGYKHSVESRRRMSEAQRGRWPERWGQKEAEAPLCACGCGELVERTRGRWNQYLKHHQSRGPSYLAENRRGPLPLCECGCGERVKLLRPGYPNQFIRGHNQKGAVLSKDTRRKLSKAHMGTNNYNWRGGISFEPYGPEFNGALRRAVRERDGCRCRLCGIPENGQAHACHHIDYDKANNEPMNFSALCAPCHAGTNGHREFWQDVLQGRRAIC